MIRSLVALSLVAVLACTASDTPPKPATAVPSAEPAAASEEHGKAQAEPATAPVGDVGNSEPAADEPTPEPKAGKDFAADVKLLYDLAACGAEAAPGQVSAAFHKRYCASVNQAIDRYRKRWHEVAVPKLAELVPADIPSRVVYPFGGGDLLTALATYPNATEITTMSLELAGDVSLVSRADRAKLEGLLDKTRQFVRYLLQVVHSKTSNMREIMREDLPAQLVFGLIAMRINDQEPVALRYFKLNDDGSVNYYEQAELDAALEEAKGKKEIAQVFANAEIEFRNKGGGDVRIWRHFGVNLDDDHLAENPALLAHLRKKGKVAAMTKAASYLLWWNGFSTMRNYLLENAVWMISDSTGILPEHAEPAGFEQITYGTFEAPFLEGAGSSGTKQLRKLYANQPKRPLPYRYGYPDGSEKKHNHMMITRKKAP